MSEWTTTTLKDICEPMNGIWKGVKEPFISAKILRATNFSKDCKLKLDDVAIIDVEKKKLDSRRLQRGDIVVEKSGGGPNQPVGRVILFNLDDGDYSFCNFTSALRIKDKSKVLPEFLYKYLVYLYFEGETEKYQSNLVGFRNLDFKGYTSMVVRFPNTISEQQRIVDILDREFEKIDRVKSNAELNLQHAKDLFQAALAKELEPKEGWVKEKVECLCDILDKYRKPISKRDRKVGIYPYYGASCVQDYVDDFIFDGRYLLIGEDGAKWGSGDNTAYIVEGKFWVNNHAHIVKCKENVIDTYLLYYFIFYDFTEKVAGAIIPKLTQETLRNLEVPVPQYAEQQQIVATLDGLNAKCGVLQENYTKTIALCDDLKQSLLRKAFNGEL